MEKKRRHSMQQQGPVILFFVLFFKFGITVFGTEVLVLSSSGNTDSAF